VVILLFAALFVTWLSYRWHAFPSALLFWAGPALLAAIAVWAGREHAFHGRRRVAIFVPLLAYQIQLMIYGMLYSIGSIMAGSSPI
jgi:cyanate permease